MRSKTLMSTAFIMAGLTMAGLQQAMADKGGTDVLHYTVTATFTGAAQGTVTAMLKEQGNAAHQSLSIQLKSLIPSTNYTLQAWLTGLSNAVDVTEFTSDPKGAATLIYNKNIASKSNGKGKDKGKGKGKGLGAALPVGLDPVTGILGLDVVTFSTTVDISNVVTTVTQVVASADLANPTKYQYLVQRNMENDGVIDGAAGSLRLRGQNNTQQFMLKATGLVTNTPYTLSINTVAGDTLVSDKKGKITFKTLPAGSPNVLDIWSVELLGADTNSVLSTTLP